MTRRRTRKLTAAALVLASLASLACLAHSFSAAPLPEPEPLSAALPTASPPADMALVQLPTGVTYRSAAEAYRGGSFRDRRDFAMTAVLVKHPRGDVLIDTGFGRDIDAQFREMPLPFRAVTTYAKGRSAAQQLDGASYDRRRLRGILLTHAHWDHVSGIPEFPEVPVLVNADERRFIDEGGWLTAIARTAAVRYDVYPFEGGPYLGFPRSHDVYGDGSIVVVPAPGHTPGSVIAFVTLPRGQRYAFVGDLAWQREGITEREERPWLARTFADHRPEGVRENLLRMAAIATRFPEMVLVPAHDARAFAAMPQL